MSSGSSSGTRSNSWTLVDIPQDTLEAERNARLVESGIRIACAGFAGLLVGLSYSNKAASAKVFQRTVVSTSKKQRPPGAMPRLKAVQPASETNYPFMWGGSFVVFMSILETCQFWSPTSLAMKAYQRSLVEEEEEDLEDDNFLETEWPQFAQEFPGGPESIATIGDYTLGGTVAGLAVGFSKQRPPPSSSSTSPLQLPSSITNMGRRSLVLSGLGSGIALGMLAGASIAGLRVAEAMALEEAAKEEAMKVQEELLEREAEEQRLKEVEKRN